MNRIFPMPIGSEGIKPTKPGNLEAAKPGWTDAARSASASGRMEVARLPPLARARGFERRAHVATAIPRQQRGTRALVCGLVGVVAGMTGCGSPSFLVTPVPRRHALVETEISRDALLVFDKIAMIDVTGVIRNAPDRQLLGEGEHAVSRFVEQLEKARRDPLVKAIVLRINSPGGTVVASELMHAELEHFKKSGKPVIAVMLDLAASGGYYIACAADEIIAQPSTVTGSIGVIMQLFDFSGTMERIGVTGNAITSGGFKDAGSPFRALRPEDRDVFQSIVDDMYERFVDVVVAGRPNLTKQRVRELADGRVYSAPQALDAGLIDRIADMREALAIAKKRAGVRRARVVRYHRPHAYRPGLYSSAPAPPPQINLLNVNLSGLAPATTDRFLYLWQPGAS